MLNQMYEIPTKKSYIKLDINKIRSHFLREALSRFWC